METTATITEFENTSDSAPPSAPVLTRTREGKELIDASRPFAEEDRARSWFHVVETLGALVACLAVAGALPWNPWWPARLAASVVAGLVVVRSFILFHDYQHGAILRGSKLAKVIFDAFGFYVLTPPTVWKQTHNYHHANTAKLVGSHIGSYMMITVDMWRQASPRQRLAYKVTRHPLTMLFGYVTIFLWGMCVSPYLRDKRKHRWAPLALVLHFVALGAITALLGWRTTLTVQVIPAFVALATGAYLFYAQHNFPGMHVEPRETWTYTRAALESSSYMECSPLVAWFTGNIGYHHVHHLNPGIPFYRLPEAMAAIPELHDPIKTSLRPRDVAACLRLKLWDPAADRMVPYPD